MNLMFGLADSFNGNLSLWDVSLCTDMEGMFYKASTFESDLSSWDIGAVTSTEYMFEFARAFNSDISRWNVSRLKDASFMFTGAKSFQQNLCDWGSRLNTSALVTDAFVKSGCPNISDPNLTAVPKGPFCHVCGV